MRIDKRLLLIIVVILIAAFLRLWNLAANPPHLTPDEASLGYNAYSILKTGKDEYGRVIPFVFKSFGDYKPGLYVYLTVPSVLLFGLTEFAVRLPSALSGVVSVFLIYLVVKKLFSDKLGLITLALAALNPWLIYFSRGAWEVNIALTLSLLGIYLFLRFLEKPKYLLFSVLAFSLTFLAYQGAKLSTEIVVLILTILYWKSLIKTPKKYLLASFVLGLIISVPIVLSFFNGQTGRLNVFSVFSYPRSQDCLVSQLKQGNETVGNLSYYLFHTETLNFVRGIMGRWFNHFSGRFLFFEGDWENPRHTAPNSGMLTLFDLILLPLGLVFLVKKGFSKANSFVWLWLILAPLPAILSRDQVHAVRALHLSVPLIIILSFGAYYLWEMVDKVRKKVLKDLICVIVLTLYLASFIYFLDALFIHLPKHDSRLWEYGYKQIVETVTPIQNRYEKIKVQQSYAQPYIFFLFFQRYDPTKYQKQAKLTEGQYGDVGQVEKLDNIFFSPIDWSVSRGEEKTLFVADTIKIPLEDSKDTNLFNLISEIRYLNGRDIAFRIIEIK